MGILESIETTLSKPETKKAPPKAEANKEIGMARATQNKEELVQTARRIARTMAENGPVTIEDVCDEMAKQNYPVWAGSKESPQNWKGSVFNSSEFVCVGHLPSRKATNNGRHVRQWALKSWVRKNSMNGSSGTKSAFDFVKIYNDYMHRTNEDPKNLVWIVGTDLLQENFAVSAGKGMIFGIDVIAIPGVGSVLTDKKSWNFLTSSASTATKN